MYSRIKLRKKDLEKDPRYQEMIWEVYEKLEKEWQNQFDLQGERLWACSRRLKNERIMTAVNKEEFTELREENEELKIENKVMRRAMEEHGIVW